MNPSSPYPPTGSVEDLPGETHDLERLTGPYPFTPRLGVAEREPCDRVPIIIARVFGLRNERSPLTDAQMAELTANIRIALDTEVEAGGPYLNNGWNKPTNAESR